MSKKHVVNYYNTVCEQYHQFIEELEDFEEACAKGMVSPEIIENAKQTIEPLKINWETLNYIMYLLNKPNKKKKESRYTKANEKKMQNMRTDKEVIQENSACIEKLKQISAEV